MEDNLNFLKIEDNLNFLKIEDNLNFWKIEDDFNYFVNGWCPTFCVNGNQPQIFSKMEDDICYEN
jgi:hypothetical protein